MAPELALEESLLRLVLVAVLAGAIGVERELRDQDAGLRTHMLVGVGAALFVLAGNFAWTELTFGSEEGVVLDPSRVVAYVVTGVGFLGAGAIIKTGATVRGLTTAASLWVVAAIGVVVGSGEYVLGVLATGAVLLSLWPVKKLAGLLGIRSSHSRHLVVELEPGARVNALVAAVEDAGAEVLSTTIADDLAARRLTMAVAGKETDMVDLLQELAQAPDVRTASLGGG